MATVEPLVVIALGVGFLGETLAPMQILGALLVLAGVLLAQTATPSEIAPDSARRGCRRRQGRGADRRRLFDPTIELRRSRRTTSRQRPVESRPMRSRTPTAPEVPPLVEGQAGRVVGHDPGLESPDARGLRPGHERRHERVPTPRPRAFAADVDAQLGHARVRRPARSSGSKAAQPTTAPLVLVARHQPAIGTVGVVPGPPMSGARQLGTWHAGRDSFFVDHANGGPVARAHCLDPHRAHRRSIDSPAPGRTAPAHRIGLPGSRPAPLRVISAGEVSPTTRPHPGGKRSLKHGNPVPGGRAAAGSARPPRPAPQQGGDEPARARRPAAFSRMGRSRDARPRRRDAPLLAGRDRAHPRRHGGSGSLRAATRAI